MTALTLPAAVRSRALWQAPVGMPDFRWGSCRRNESVLGVKGPRHKCTGFANVILGLSRQMGRCGLEGTPGGRYLHEHSCLLPQCSVCCSPQEGSTAALARAQVPGASTGRGRWVALGPPSKTVS